MTHVFNALYHLRLSRKVGVNGHTQHSSHILMLFIVSCACAVFTIAAASQGIASQLPVLETHTISDQYGRPIIYHISRPAKPAPLLLVIQGSGCGSVLQGEGASAQSNLYDLQGFAEEGRFAVMAVEKPFARAEASGGSAEVCGQKFNEDFTAERWLVALRAAIADARRDPIVDRGRFMVIGMSEGAVMASLLAQADKGVTDVVAIGGSGTTQIFDFTVRAYTDCFDRSVCIAEIEQQLSAIRRAPDSATQFAWGHPYRRWSSFFAVDPGTALLQSKARVYLAFGTADDSTPPLSQEVAVAKLFAAGRDVTVRRVIGANHSLMLPGEDFSALEREYRRIFDWFWSSAPRSVPND